MLPHVLTDLIVSYSDSSSTLEEGLSLRLTDPTTFDTKTAFFVLKMHFVLRILQLGQVVLYVNYVPSCH